MSVIDIGLRFCGRRLFGLIQLLLVLIIVARDITTVFGLKKLYCYSAITQHGMTPPIFIIGESIKGDNYFDIVFPHLIREVKQLMGDELFLFMQDGAPAHKANLTQQWLRDHDITFIPREEWS